MKKTIVRKKEQFYFDIMIGISLILTLAFICFAFQGAYKIYHIQELRNQSIYTVQKDIRFDRNEDISAETESAMEYEEQSIMSDPFGYLETLRKIKTGNLFMYIEVYLGKAGLSEAVTVLLIQNEPLKYPLKSGRYWEYGSDNQNTVIIGTGVLKSTYLDGEKRYLLIDNEPYEVIGILEDLTGNKSDFRIFANYQWIDGALKNKLSYGGSNNPYNITCWRMVSDYSDIDKELMAITEWGKQYYPNFEIVTMDAPNEWEFGYFLKLLKYFILGLIIFSLYNSCIIAKLLFERYKRDLIIMRVFGFGNRKIIWYFYHKVWLCYGIGIMGALLVFRKPQFLLPAVGLFLLFMLTTIVPIINILRNRSIRKIGTNLFEVI
ncbi:MAG: ABC transporter permease [Lachnospiraceae bacterium]|nr:ABC transporter permease [Lachnospiraceae bacterium]